MNAVYTTHQKQLIEKFQAHTVDRSAISFRGALGMGQWRFKNLLDSYPELKRAYEDQKVREAAARRSFKPKYGADT